MHAGEHGAPVAERGPVPAALKRFLWDIQSMVELAEGEREILAVGRDLMARLFASDDWLPAAFSVATPGAARQFQIYRDGMERFCVASTILSGGAALSIAQPGIWEIAGALRGSIDREPLGGSMAASRLRPGSVETRRSGSENACLLSNAPGEQISVAIHVYGGAIERLGRRAFEPNGASGEELGYANGENAPPFDIFSIQADIRD
ncbi:hypothetical protein [Methylocystis sp. S23]|jgi:predicted metal-dependent enzyme (double-stranded beta helix superfamily)